MKSVVSLILLLMPLISLKAQERYDSLDASRIVSDISHNATNSAFLIDRSLVQNSPSPMGFGDVYKFLQLLPGVSTGAEGASSFYARGANQGNNRLTLDGIPIYGISHLLGFVSVIPQEILDSSEFRMGGFGTEDIDLTASHTDLVSKESVPLSTQASSYASNFSAGAYVSIPFINNKLTFIGSARIFPIGGEYKLVKPLIDRCQTDLQNIKGMAYDVYGKLRYQISVGRSLSMSVFGSNDCYSFDMSGKDVSGLSYSNFVTNMHYVSELGNGLRHETSVSYNAFHSFQQQITYLYGDYNCLEIKNNLDELALLSNVKLDINCWNFKVAISGKYTRYNPGNAREYSSRDGYSGSSMPFTNNAYERSLFSAYLQAKWDSDRNHFRAAVGGNLQLLKENTRMQTMSRPDVDLVYSLDVSPYLSLESTFDYKSQYSHLLEGMPMGWTLDLVVPADNDFKPESSCQIYVGSRYSKKYHDFRVGLWAKYLNGIVCLTDPSLLFSSSLAGWKSLTEQGKGRAMGLEILYNGAIKSLTWHVAYTLSKSDRQFQGLNHGRTFPARYDRRHVANANAEYVMVDNCKFKLSYRTFLTMQTGYWETIANCNIREHTIYSDEYAVIPIASSYNDTKMPYYTRWDNYLAISLHGKRTVQDISIGVYNTTNRHNPSFVFYDGETERWKSVSLIPIMPTISYKVQW